MRGGREDSDLRIQSCCELMDQGALIPMILVMMMKMVIVVVILVMLLL
ncbi:hypothetical protein A2U01_0080457 [Trifolium medium]|uniref:Uncharacterized protein n=1 Tax=Trifolium medium TaxID=97028 RepID=A0A392TE39_9FABA|nr:hypothetical protein [Trifolium medium]